MCNCYIVTSVCVSRYSGSVFSMIFFLHVQYRPNFHFVGVLKLFVVCSCFRYSIISEGATNFLGRTNSSLGILALENSDFKW